jgi:hypothetical protein
MQKYLSHKGDDVGGKRRGRACRTSNGGARVWRRAACYLHVKRSVFWLKFWRDLPNHFQAWGGYPLCSLAKSHDFIFFGDEIYRIFGNKKPKCQKSTLNYGDWDAWGKSITSYLAWVNSNTCRDRPPGIIIIETQTEVCRNNRSGFTSNRRASKLLARQLVLPANTSVNICCGCSPFCTLSESTFSPRSLLSAFDRSRRRMTALLRI